MFHFFILIEPYVNFELGYISFFYESDQYLAQTKCILIFYLIQVLNTINLLDKELKIQINKLIII